MKNEDSITNDTTGLADRLRVVSEQAGSLKALSEIAEIPYPTLMRYMQGTEPKRVPLANIVSRLNVNGTWLLTGEGEPFVSPDTAQGIDGSKGATKLPKFSEQAYNELLSKADNFSTRDLQMKSVYSSVYQSQKDYASTHVMNKLLGTDSLSDIVTFDFEDARIPNGPIQIYVNLAQLKPRHHQRVLVMQSGRPYLMRGVISGSPAKTRLVDEAKEDPIPEVSYEQLIRDDAIIGTVVGTITRG